MNQRLRERGRSRRDEEGEEKEKEKKKKKKNSSRSSSLLRTRSETRSTTTLSSTYSYIRSSHPHPPDGFKRSTSLLHHLSFIFFVLLSLLIACACLYDIIRQTVSEVRTTAIGLTTIAIGSCFVVLIVSILIWISRYFTVKYSLSLIPRPYVPITQVDLPGPIYQAINQEYGRVAIISHLSSKSDRRPHQQRFGLEGWGKPGTIHAGKRFADEVLKDFKAMDRVLVDLLPHQPTSVIATRRSSLEGPLNRYLEILSPSSPTQPTPILLTPAQKLLLKRYASVVTKAVTPSQVVTVSDYELACKCLVILVDRINQCRSEDWVNPPGYGRKGDPIYEGVRFRDAIIETAIKLEQSLSQTLGIQAHNQPTKSNRPVMVRSPSPSAQLPTVNSPSHGPVSTSSVNGATKMNGKDAIESLIKKIFPLIYPPRLPSLFGPIITRYENILKDILVYHPHIERTVEEYEYSLRCVASIISHVHPNLANE